MPHIVSLVASRPRLFSCLALMVVLTFALPDSLSPALRLLVAWNVGIGLYLALMARLMVQADEALILRRAAEQDIGSHVVLVLATLAALLSFGAVGFELRGIHDATGLWQGIRIALVVMTILTSWLFVQTIFALHYAHGFYGRNGRSGLAFPGTATPHYWDFLYFSFTIGSAFATSDVNVTSTAMRKVVLAHTVLSFLFNTMILGLSINVGAGLL